jgi:signal peptidase II
MKAVPANRYAIFFSIAILGCLVDLATKSWIFDRLGGPREQGVWWIWEDVVGFQTSLNEGALFGFGQGWVVVFAALSIVAALAVLYWLFIARAAHDLLLTVALGSVAAGIFGNLYDRLGLPGLQWKHPWIVDDLHRVGEPVYAVRDWILVMIGTFPWPTFNVADSMLVCGAILLVWHAFRHDAARPPGADDASRRRPQARQAKPSASADAPSRGLR